MSLEEEDRLRRLPELIEHEHNPEKLRALVDELLRLLIEHQPMREKSHEVGAEKRNHKAVRVAVCA
jgi:hypothetical protein